MKRKKRHLHGPRRKRMNRRTRLRAAKATDWVEQYEGRDIVRGYARWFGVDPLCAIVELRMLGVSIDQEREAGVRASMEGSAAARKRREESAAAADLEPRYATDDPCEGGLASAWDYPAIEEWWCEDRRVDVAEYLDREGVDHGGICEWPAWQLGPRVFVWAVRSKDRPGRVGWWVISGDLPMDHVSAAGIKRPRDAVCAIAESWLDASAYLREVERLPEIILGIEEKGPTLESWAHVLLEWVADPWRWDEGLP